LLSHQLFKLSAEGGSPRGVLLELTFRGLWAVYKMSNSQRSQIAAGADMKVDLHAPNRDCPDQLKVNK